MTAEELTKAFLKTPAMIEHAKVIDTVNARLDEGDTETVSLQVPKQFLAMLEYDERENAAHEGRKPEPVIKVLGRMLHNQLHERLHWLVVAPAHFPRYRDLWNRYCDEQGAPEHKILTPGEASPKDGEEDPF